MMIKAPTLHLHIFRLNKSLRIHFIDEWIKDRGMRSLQGKLGGYSKNFRSSYLCTETLLPPLNQ